MVLVFLEIARTAFLSLSRKLGLWLVGLAALTGAGLLIDPRDVRPMMMSGLGMLVGLALPAVAGRGLRAGLHGGPLGLAGRSASYRATLGYGLGAAVLALPFAVAGAVVLSPDRWADAAFMAAAAVLGSAWLGAAFGRLTKDVSSVVFLTWGGGLVCAGGSFELLRGLGALMNDPLLAYHFDALLACLSLVAAHGLMLFTAAVDPHKPTQLER